MSIIQFPDIRENLIRINNEKQAPDIQSELWTLITKTPDKINDIINHEYISPEKLLIINTEELKALIIDYIIYHLNRTKIILEGSILFWIQYISDLILKILFLKWDEIKLIIENPYYTHWIGKGFPKRAGDASVYSYLFWSFNKKPINKKDYIRFATSAYYEYSNDTAFANWIWNMLPIVENINKDNNFLNRWIVKAI